MALNRIVLKVGTQVLLNNKGTIDEGALKKISDTIAELKKRGFDIVVVSSGAIGLGSLKLKLTPPLTTSEKQASASVGQGLLMKMYEQELAGHQLACGQILVTAADFSSRNSYLNLRDTFETLLKFGVIPIVNENDSVSIAEIQENEQHSFGDNDKLSSIVASKIEADLLVILTNVDGVYTKNPQVDPKAEKIKLIKNISDLKHVSANGKSEMGRGGMQAKLEAAKMAAICGVGVVITSLEKLSSLQRLNKDVAIESFSDVGTVLLPSKILKGKKKWIGTSSGFKAVIEVNEGAKRALTQRNASLLSVGIVSCKGDFERGDIVSVRDELNGEIARGLTRLSSAELKELSSRAPVTDLKKSSQIVIHRDELALFFEPEKESTGV